MIGITLLFITPLLGYFLFINHARKNYREPLTYDSYMSRRSTPPAEPKRLVWANLGWGNYFFALWGLLLGLAVWFVSMLIATLIVSGLAGPTLFKTDRYDLAALSTGGTEYSGQMFLVSGYFSGESQIKFIREDQGGLVVRSVDTDSAWVFEEDTDAPYVAVETYATVSPAWLMDIAYINNRTYNFHVPIGSVQSNYNIDISEGE